MYQYYVYILCSKRNGTLYIGFTNNLIRRVQEHREKLCEGFTERYDVIHLVYFETGENVEGAIMREKQLKKWKRKWKIELIESHNPKWKDLYEDLGGPPDHRLPHCTILDPRVREDDNR